VKALLDRLLTLLGLGNKAAITPLSERSFVPSNHPLRATLDDRYLAMRAAMAAEDGAAVAAILTDDFVSIDVKGKRTTAREMINQVLHLNIDRSKRTVATTLVEISTNPGIATVLQHYSMTTTGNALQTMPTMVQSFSTDTWREVDGTWRLARTETRETEAVFGTGGRRVKKSPHE